VVLGATHAAESERPGNLGLRRRDAVDGDPLPDHGEHRVLGFSQVIHD
jgi:hypothetical protein